MDLWKWRIDWPFSCMHALEIAIENKRTPSPKVDVLFFLSVPFYVPQRRFTLYVYSTNMSLDLATLHCFWFVIYYFLPLGWWRSGSVHAGRTHLWGIHQGSGEIPSTKWRDHVPYQKGIVYVAYQGVKGERSWLVAQGFCLLLGITFILNVNVMLSWMRMGWGLDEDGIQWHISHDYFDVEIVLCLYSFEGLSNEGFSFSLVQTWFSYLQYLFCIYLKSL